MNEGMEDILQNEATGYVGHAAYAIANEWYGTARADLKDALRCVEELSEHQKALGVQDND